MMHTYRILSQDVFHVGYYIHVPGYKDVQRPEWVTLSTHRTEQAAIRRVNFLNGGSVVTTE